MKKRSQESQRGRGPHSLKRFKELYDLLKVSIGQDNVNTLIKELSGLMEGQRVTIPTLKALEREMRDTNIRQQYDSGISRKELALKFKVSERTIDSILSNGPIFEGFQ